MIAAQNSIIVYISPDQKEKYLLGESIIKAGKKYSINYRERTPVVAQIVEGLGELKTGKSIVTSYTHFGEDSPYLLYDNTYSIPVDELILAFIEDDGSLNPVCGNLIVDRVPIKTTFLLPDELQKFHNDRGIVVKGNGVFKKGDFLLFLRFSDYEIVYTWKDEERRAIKIYKDEIVGILKN